MSLKPCHECKHQVSSDAKNCPQCGAKQKKPVGLVGWFFAILLGASAYQCSKPSSTTALPAAAKSPEALIAETAEAKASSARYSFGAEMVKAVALNLRDPDSLVVEALLSNNEASTGCIAYRAKNGFGGMNREVVIFTNGKAKKGNEAWSKHCLNKMNDLMAK